MGWLGEALARVDDGQLPFDRADLHAWCERLGLDPARADEVADRVEPWLREAVLALRQRRDGG
ncbi:MAG: hypothetical protein MUF03_06415 [Rubrivivax sp.]|jgi:hypothetical protein|nr:hypothetical protein [Rubrivivax sp.]